MRKKTEKPNKEVLEKLYNEEYLTTYELSEKFSVNRRTIGRWLDSYEIKRKYGTKRSRASRDVKLSSKQNEYIAGSLLGDDALSHRNNKFNPVRLQIGHSVSQSAYVDWKRDILNSITTSNVREYFYKPTKSYPNGFTTKMFSTIHHPELVKYWELFYPNGIKVVPHNIGDLLTPFSLAVWYMDDGSYSTSTYKGRTYNDVRIHTQGFKQEDCNLLVNVLKKNFSIKSKVSKSSPHFLIIKDVETFFETVKPFIIPSMNYKITRSPTTTR